MVRKRMESMSWKMAVLAPIPRARVRTATRVKPGLRRRNRKAWRRSRQNEIIVSPWLYQTTGETECHVDWAPKNSHPAAVIPERGSGRETFPSELRPSSRPSNQHEELRGRQLRTLSMRLLIFLGAASLGAASLCSWAAKPAPWPPQLEMRVPFEPTAFPSGPH